MMKRIFVTLCFLCVASTIMAQEIYNSSGRAVAAKPQSKKTKGFDRDNMVLGGDFRLFFGQNLSLGLAPMVGYKMMDDFYVGVRLGYNYDRLRVDPQSLPAGASKNIFNLNSYTGGVWARFLFYQSIYIHSEFAYNIYDDYVFDFDFKKVRHNAPAALVGIGFTQPVSDRASFNTTILYDVLKDPKSYYHYIGGGFDFRFGFLVGF